MGASSAPQPFSPPNQTGAAAGLQGAASTLSSAGSQIYGAAQPGFAGVVNSITNNPYYGTAQTGAGGVAQTGVPFGQSEVSSATGLQGLATSLGQYAPGIAATAFDPQNALYNQQYQANQNQTNVANAQNGVGGSPFAAGLSAQSGQDFNLNWLNNQQARENAGVAAIGQLGQTTASLDTSAGDLGAAGLNTELAASAAPSNAYTAQQNQIAQALQAMVTGDVGATAPTASAGGLEDQYLQIGQESAQTSVAAYQAQQQADTAFWGGITSLLGTLGTGLGTAAIKYG